MTLAEKVAKSFGINVDDMTSRRRFEKIRLPRQVYCYLLSKYTKMTTSAIAAHIGNGNPYNHSTVIHSRRRVEDLIWGDKNIAAIVAEIEKDIYDYEMPVSTVPIIPAFEGISEAVETLSDEDRYIIQLT